MYKWNYVSIMEFTRKQNKAIATVRKDFVTPDLYIRFIVDLYSSMEIKREYWLTDREKDFFVATVIQVLSGCKSPIEDEAVQIYKKYFYVKTTKVKISDYLNRICKKNWAKYDKMTKTVTIPPIFEDINLVSDQMEFDVSFNFQNEDNDEEADGSDIRGVGDVKADGADAFIPQFWRSGAFTEGIR